MTTTHMTHDQIRQHMSETLVCSPETIAAAKALLIAGCGMQNDPRDPTDRLVFSTLTIDGHGNEDVDCIWTGEETVTDPGALFLDRVEAWKHNGAVRAAGPADIGTAVVYHSLRDGEVLSSMFIDH